MKRKIGSYVIRDSAILAVKVSFWDRGTVPCVKIYLAGLHDDYVLFNWRDELDDDYIDAVTLYEEWHNEAKTHAEFTFATDNDITLHGMQYVIETSRDYAR